MRRFGSPNSLVAALALSLVVAASPLLAAPLQLVDVGSGQSRSVELGGGVTHVVFLASWCPPCVDELSTLTSYRDRWQRSGYRLVLVAVQSRQDLAKLQRFAAGRELPAPLQFDRDGAAERALRAEGLPVHIVFGADGNELGRARAADEALEAMLDRAIHGPVGDADPKEPMSQRIALLFGGRSTEHEVSVRSARSVAEAMRQAGYEVVPIAVTGEGRWLCPEVSAPILDGTAARAEADPAAPTIQIDPAGGGLRRADDGRRVDVQAAFPLVHGWGGEDGRFQGLLDLAGIPYAGSGLLGSSAAMDKASSKRLLEAVGLPVVPWRRLDAADYATAPERQADDLIAALGLPLFVKPSNGGSSVGIHRVDRRDDLQAAIEDAAQYDRVLVIEQGVDAREIECAVLGNEAPQASVLGEIVPRDGGFYDYAAKYLDDSAALIIPASIETGWSDRLRSAALQAYRSHDLCGYARVDFLVEKTLQKYYINEMNTLPGFTSISMFPKLWSETGVSFPDLVRRLIELAMERASQLTRLRTRWQGVRPPVTR